MCNKIIKEEGVQVSDTTKLNSNSAAGYKKFHTKTSDHTFHIIGNIYNIYSL